VEQGSHPATGLVQYQIGGEFAGILQVKIRQRVSGERMLMAILCEGSMWLCVEGDT